MQAQEAQGERYVAVAERAIAEGQRGRLDSTAVLWIIAASELWIGSADESQGDRLPTSPLVVGREGGDGVLLAVFTGSELLAPMLGGRVPVRVPGFELLRRMTPGTDVVVNPGHSVGMELPAETVARFVADVAAVSIP